MKIFITRPIPEVGIKLLQSAGHEVTLSPHDRALSPAELLAGTTNTDGLLSLLTDRIDAPLPRRPPQHQSHRQLCRRL